MSRLSLIRFGTYGILLVAMVLATRLRYVIPVNLAFFRETHSRGWVEESAKGAVTLAQDTLPGFGDTLLSGSTVLRLSEESVKESGISLAELDPPKIRLELRGKRLLWRVMREVRKSLGDGTIWVIVLVDDQTGRTTLERYKRWVFEN